MFHLLPEAYSLAASIAVLLIALWMVIFTLLENRFTNGDPERANHFRKLNIVLLLIGMVLILIK